MELAGPRGSTLRAVILAASLAVVAGLFAPLDAAFRVDSSHAQAPSRPNVVVIFTDDQDVRSMDVMAKTRSLLGRQGTTFTRSFATFPLCCPSRATLLTGQYAHNHGVLGNRAPRGGYARYRQRGTLPIVMRRAGYRTGWIGKFMNGYGQPSRGGDPQEVPRGWDTWVAPVNSPHAMYNYTLNEDGDLRHYGQEPRHYQTDVYAEKSAQFIRRSAPSRQPFLLVMAPLAPHSEHARTHANPRPAPRHRNALRGHPYRVAPSFNERDVSDKPSFVRKRPRLDRSDRRRLRRAYFDRRRSLLAVDDAVARLVSELERTGELDNTVIIYTSDNGFMLGEHRLRGKFDLYDESARVPLMLRGPGIPAGARRPQLTGNVDLSPTILDIAGAEAILPMDGRSLLALANDRHTARGRKMLLENGDSSAILTRRYMYANHRGNERELYDMRRDPYQLKSLHRRKKLAPVQRRLARRLRRIDKCAGARCP